MEPVEILCGIIALCLAVYYYLTSNYDFWKSRGVRGPKPLPGFGNFKDVIFNKKYTGDYLRDIYNEYKDEGIIGIFSRKTPILLVKNPELIKNVLIKDFSNFANRGLPVSEKYDPLSQNLVGLKHERWRPLRTKLSPVFTSGKLKEMFSLMSECADHLEQYIDKLIDKDEPVECCELTAKFTIEVIGTCVFGLEMNALTDENSEFRKMGKLIFAPSWINNLLAKIKQFLPLLYEVIHYFLPRSEITTFFTRFVKDAITYREMNNVIKHDFIDILRELKKHPDKVGDISK